MAVERPNDLTTAEVAECSGFCVKTVYRAIQCGEQAARKVRSRWLVAEGDFKDWYAGGELVARPGQLVTEPATPLPPAERGSRAALRAIESEAA